ncbi:MAG: ester cyclase [Candidatus Latescibacterota bacterium]
MAARDNKARIRRFFEEVMGGQKPEALETYVIRDYIEHEEMEGVPSGREGLRQKLAQVHSAFPDVRVTIDDIMAEGDKVMVHSTWRGTHRGEFNGLAPTGRQFVFECMDILRLEDDKVVEHWGVADTHTLLEHLGVLHGFAVAAREPPPRGAVVDRPRAPPLSYDPCCLWGLPARGAAEGRSGGGA